MTARRVAWGLLVALLCLGIAVATGLGGWQLIIKSRPAPEPVADRAAVRQQVINVVRTNLPTVMSYTPDISEADLGPRTALLTGKFLTEYQKAMRDSVIPQARQTRITSIATVVRAGVDSVSEDKARVLAFVNTTATKGDQSPSQSQNAVLVGLTNVHGSWLMESFEPKGAP
ncbi:hypothetical protein BTO20_04760 [Mycobacterium dioxanotrophicus]|uniref:Twin-arginine translocation pathway signal n=1 Tax=Mycobacterium dioxanotrophicus TaxID=482462 RepID=A0A1Y0BYK1_9MYCO|nr:hypothetical protein [Mycobacterium dioxanotrophicus]ART67993.1 hypothetical protein BTO20_04760 [Mycobacterium dioxanotrophicus]